MVKSELKHFQPPRQTNNHRSKRKGKPKRHAKQFRCGLIDIVNNEIKKIPLNQGGGSRFCQWHYFHMDFDTVRQRLIRLYNIDQKTNEISLYDYQCNVLDEKRYRSVGDYIKSNGLSCNSTLIYICATKKNQAEEQKPNVNKNALPLSSIIPKLEPQIPELMNVNNIKQERFEVKQDSKKDIAIYTSSR